MLPKKKDDTLPKRWLATPQRSTLIAEKFVVFKTPLDSKFDHNVGKHKFNFDILKESLEKEQLKLKFVIDLTFSDRFYDPQILENDNIKYLKIKCKGKDEAPDAAAKNLFMREVKGFQGGEGEIIGVHCTHGLNRSGFMIVSYLVDEFDYGLDAAILEFRKSRYPGIYKEGYVQNLCDVYKWDREDVPGIAEFLPSWVTDPNSNDHPEFYEYNKNFMDGEVGNVDTVVFLGEALRVQKAVQAICDWKGLGFPGGQPVSISIENIGIFEKEDYMVSWKADGTRYLMFIEREDNVFLLDRDNTVFKAHKLTFPWQGEHLYETLVDGEMVIDVENGIKTPRFLIYDIITFQNEYVGEKTLIERQNYIRKMLKERNIHVDKRLESFRLRLKEFWNISCTAKLLKPEFIKNLPHETDGLIFQPAEMPYKTGKCEYILKWKPPIVNSIDFKVKINVVKKLGHPASKLVEFYAENTRVHHQKFTKEFQDMNDKIIECWWNGNCWMPMRERTDKSFSNNYVTYQNIWETIKNPVTEHVLLQKIYNSNKRPNEHRLNSEIQHKRPKNF